jgi:hypothetical protein
MRRKLRKPINPASKRFRPPILDAPKTPGPSTVIEFIGLVSKLIQSGRQDDWISDALTDDQLAELRQKDHAVRSVCADLRIDPPDVAVRPSIGFCRTPYRDRERRLSASRLWLEAMLTLLEEVAAEEKRALALKSSKGKRRPKGTMDHRMMELIRDDPDAQGWTARQFAERLKCSPSTVCGTKTWKRLQEAREQAKLDRAQNARYRRNGRNARE